MNNAIFYSLSLSFVAGVAWCSFFSIPSSVGSLFVVIALAVASNIFLRNLHCEVTIDSRTVIFCFVVALCGLSLGIVRTSFVFDNIQNDLAPMVGQQVTLTGPVVREPERRDRTTHLVVEVEDTRVLVITDRYTPVDFNDVITVSGVLEKPEIFMTEFGREFDYQGYLLSRGITQVMFFAVPEIVSSNHNSWLYWLYEAKKYFLESLSLVLRDPAFGLGAGLLLGVPGALDKELENDFRVAGIIHIVVLSGYNIMLVVAFIAYVLSFVLPWRSRLIVGIGAVFIFALIVGYSPSVMRASIMAVLFLLATLIGRPHLLLRALVLTGALMIFLNPYILRYDIGFQLSFMATLGLILVAPHFELILVKTSKIFDFKSYFIATIATQIAVAPLILYHIGQLSIIAVPVNLLVLPLVPVAMLFTFATGFLAMFSNTLALPVAFFTEIFLSLIIFVAEQSADWSFSAISVPKFSGYWVIFSYALLGIFLFLYRNRILSESKPIQLSLNNNLSVSNKMNLDDWEIVEESFLTESKKTKN